MNEIEIAERIVTRLDDNLAELPAPIVQKLQTARQAAMSAYGSGRTVNHSREGHTLVVWFLGQGLTTRLALPAVVVLASLTGLIYWQMSSHHEEEIDTGLLAGELPLHAYTDPGFETWLKHSDYTNSQQ
jgi:Protein of unknown function (DUF3619)